MPLPFSFSTQPPGSKSELPTETAATLVAEKVMDYAPGKVSTEPLLGTPGNSFSPPSESIQITTPDYPRLVSSGLPPAPSPNQRYPGNRAAAHNPVMMSPHSSLPYHSATREAAAGQDWAAQIEQLRNDVFGIAMSVSALNDRLEQQLLHSAQSAEAGIATLRSEIEAWLASHLNAAVEHCLHRLPHSASPADPHQPS